MSCAWGTCHCHVFEDTEKGKGAVVALLGHCDKHKETVVVMT